MTKAPTARPVWHGPPGLRKLLVPIGLLAPHPLNAREHDLPSIMDSLKKLGQQKPIVLVPVGRVNQEFQTIVAGHGTTFAARELGWSHIAAVESDLEDADIERFVLADNRTSDRAGYNDETLARLLAHVHERGGLGGTGYVRADLDGLLANLGQRTHGDPEKAPPVPAKPKSKPGEVYELGDHRIACGDSRDVDLVTKLLAGDTIEMVWTDPPYGVDYHDIRGRTLAGDRRAEIANRELVRDALAVAHPHVVAGGAIYVAHPDPQIRQVLDGAGWNITQTLVWVKDRFVLGRSDYNWAHEIVLYGWKPGAAHRWAGDFTQTTVTLDDTPVPAKMAKRDLVALCEQLLEAVPTTVLREPRPSRSDEHPTMKPVRLVARGVVNSSRLGDVVLDPFGGAGSTLIACETHGRRARLIELDPGYCDVVRKRYADYVGQPDLAP